MVGKIPYCDSEIVTDGWLTQVMGQALVAVVAYQVKIGHLRDFFASKRQEEVISAIQLLGLFGLRANLPRSHYKSVIFLPRPSLQAQEVG